MKIVMMILNQDSARKLRKSWMLSWPGEFLSRIRDQRGKRTQFMPEESWLRNSSMLVSLILTVSSATARVCKLTELSLCSKTSNDIEAKIFHIISV